MAITSTIFLSIGPWRVFVGGATEAHETLIQMLLGLDAGIDTSRIEEWMTGVRLLLMSGSVFGIL